MNDPKLRNAELHRISPEEYRSLPESGLVVVLDNIRSAYNVGSIFRTADAFRADKLWLCGICATPPGAEIHKTALGAENSVPWEHVPSATALAALLKDRGYTLVSVEQTRHARSLEEFRPEPGQRYALVFGNEVDGVCQEVVDASDFCLEIPQWGTKHSLNVAVSAGVVLWQFRAREVR